MVHYQCNYCYSKGYCSSMAGHSKWKNIKHKKAAADAVKMKKFTKLSKEITVAAKFGNDIGSNPTLRTLIDKANQINMPKENYMRAIKKASGVDAAHYETSFYEGYGPENVAVIVEVLSENKNRAAAEVRRVFTHNGGRVAEPGAVGWMFTKSGLFEGETSFSTEEELLEGLLDFKLHDFIFEGGDFYIAVDVNDFAKAREALLQLKCILHESHIGYHPCDKLELSDTAQEKLSHFVEVLEEVEDIQNVYLNI
jgi:YebC/PmpR family DNA-binding regulatory protein